MKRICEICGKDIIIRNVPKKVIYEFEQFSEEQFNGESGLALKWLWDFKEGLLSNPNQVLSDKIDFLADQVTRLQEEKSKKPKRKMLSGREFEEVEKNEQTK